MLFSLNKYVVSVAFFMCGMTAAYSVDMSVVNVGGVPRFAIDGKPVAATAVMPSPACKLGAAVPVLKDFSDAGVMLHELFTTSGCQKADRKSRHL